MASHSFDIDIAAEYSVHEAILIQYFDFNLKRNKAHDRHFHNGRYWTKATVKGLNMIYPYFSERQLYNTLLNLRGETSKAQKQQGKYPVVLIDTFNQAPDDKSLWYTFTDEFMQQYGECLEFCSGRLPKVEDVPEITADRLFQFCNRLFDEFQDVDRPEKATLLQFCNRVVNAKKSELTAIEQTLLQFCNRPTYNFEIGHLQFCKTLKEYILAVNSNKQQQERVDDDPPVVVAPEHPRKSYLDMSILPIDMIDDGQGGKRYCPGVVDERLGELSLQYHVKGAGTLREILQTFRTEVPTWEALDTVLHLKQDYRIKNILQLPQFMRQHGIRDVQELKKGMDYAKRRVNGHGSALAYLANCNGYVNGHCILEPDESERPDSPAWTPEQEQARQRRLTQQKGAFV